MRIRCREQQSRSCDAANRHFRLAGPHACRGAKPALWSLLFVLVCCLALQPTVMQAAAVGSCASQSNPMLPAGVLARVVIHDEPSTARDEIVLGDIACIEGDSDAVARLTGLSVGAAPLLGTERELTVPTLRLRIRQGGLDDRLVDIVGPETFLVRRKGAVVKGEVIASAVRSAIAAALPADSQLTLNLAPVDDVPVPAGEYSVVVSKLPVRLSGPVLVYVDVLVDGLPWRTVAVRGEVEVTVPVWVSTRQIQRYEILGPHNVELRHMPVSAAVQPAQLNGDKPWRANRIIQPGRIIEERYVELQPDAVSGQRVTLSLEYGPIHIQALGVLLSDAMVGTTVSVRNEDSGRVLSGILVTKDHVVVPLP